ncbi:DUF397 domain-containing protein [Phytomonospora endophytica]|uniref:DUF397 domain-containing protein n=1 Tax=Phytomonospora endophytica TaxID=714109 RepID=A0A841FXV9_9ACTN|nr:DUF397 domain-containing protein [Phytomonospora endophytica]MBB6038372.1 hypothetical protein [Phytomonospora endophytica]GIG64303.1 hypothetical protein Pen01_05980 [Phytomonospora endophytica]
MEKLKGYAEWRTSTKSGQTGNCVEIAGLPTGIGIRDTKDRAAGHLTVTPDEWRGFLATFAK